MALETTVGRADGKVEREKGTGSTFKKTLPSGKIKWIGRYAAGYTTGGSPRRFEVSGKTEAEVKQKLRDKIRALHSADTATSTNTRATVKTWATAWLLARKSRDRPQTFAGRQSACKVHIIPAIGHRRLADLSPADIRAVQKAVLSSGCNSTMAQSVHRILTKMLRDAQLEGHAVPQRCLLVDAPIPEVSDRDSIDLPDALAILSAAGELADGSRWAAALLQGMRQAECLGLTWACVDLDAGIIDVSWQLKGLPYEHGCPVDDKGKLTCGKRFGKHCAARRLRVPQGYEVKPLVDGYHLVRPKTARGHRAIPLIPWMTEALRSWKKSSPKSPYDLVWPGKSGRPQLAEADRDAWYALGDQAQVAHVDGTQGRRWLLHECRHTTATLLMEAGVDPEVIKAILGHSSIVTSRGYMHVDHTMARKAVAAVAEKLQLGA